MVPWCSGYHVCLSRRRSRVQVPSEPPFIFGFIAQSVEQRTENPCVAGSIPAGATSLKKFKASIASFFVFLLLNKINIINITNARYNLVQLILYYEML